MTRPRRFRRVLTGGSVAVGPGVTLGVDTTLVTTDAGHCQPLVDLIDNKDVFIVPVHMEVGAEVVESVKEVRAMAVATASLVDGEETYEEVRNIANACRQFMRDYHPSFGAVVLDATLRSLRAEVGGSLAVLVRILRLRPPTDFDLTLYQGRATAILEGWLQKDSKG